MGAGGPADPDRGRRTPSALLFLVPLTHSLGLLLLSAYMGGAIVTHMQHGESYIAQSVILALIWVTGFLRHSELLQSFRTAPCPRLTFARRTESAAKRGLIRSESEMITGIHAKRRNEFNHPTLDPTAVVP